MHRLKAFLTLATLSAVLSGLGGCLRQGIDETVWPSGPAPALEIRSIAAIEPRDGLGEPFFPADWSEGGLLQGRIQFRDLSFRNPNDEEVRVSIRWDEAPRLEILQRIQSVKFVALGSGPVENAYSRSELLGRGRVEILRPGMNPEIEEVSQVNGRMEFKLPARSKAVFVVAFFRPPTQAVKKIHHGCVRRFRNDDGFWLQITEGWRGRAEISREVCWYGAQSAETCWGDTRNAQVPRSQAVTIGRADLVSEEQFYEELPGFYLGDDVLWIPVMPERPSIHDRCEDSLQEL